MSDATTAQYALSDIGVSGMMVSGWCQNRLLVQIGPYWTPAVSGMMVAGLGASAYTGSGSQLRYIERDSLTITQTGQLDVPTAEFAIIVADGERRPQKGDPVVIAVGTLSARLFGGWLQSPEIEPVGLSRQRYTCTAVGWADSLQRTLIEGSWTDCYAGAIVQEIIQAAAPWLNTEMYIEPGAYITHADADLETPLVVCSRLAAQSGFGLWVDAARVVHFARQELLPASWDITDEERFGGLKVKEDESDLINRVHVRYSQIEPHSQSWPGDGETREFVMEAVPHEVLTLVVQESGQPDETVTFGRHFAEDNSEQDFSIDYTRGVVVTRAHALLTAAQTLALSGTVKIPSRLTRTHQASVSAYGSYDVLIEDRDGILSLADARAVADAELEAHAEPHLEVSYTRTERLMECLTYQLRPGMQQSLLYWDYDRTLTVREATLTVFVPAGDHTLTFQQEITLGTAPVDLAEAIAQSNATAARIIDERSTSEDYEE